MTVNKSGLSVDEKRVSVPPPVRVEKAVEEEGAGVERVKMGKRKRVSPSTSSHVT